MQPVEYSPQVRMIQPHALQGGVQFMVALRLGEPPQGLLLGQVVAFAHGLCSLPRVLHHTERKSVGAGVILSQRSKETGIACELRPNGVLRSSPPEVATWHSKI